MAVTILERPQGHVLTGTEISGSFSDDTGDALFTIDGGGTHTLSNQWIYMASNIEDYNGFWFISAGFGATGFKLLRLSTSLTFEPFIAITTGDYQASVVDHNVSAVHLPITYKLSNNIYPVNSADTVRTITSLSNNSGFAQIGLDGSLGTFEDLSFVKISGANDEDLNGVWQIIDKISTTSVILNLSYTSVNGAGILGATIQLYYSNYNFVVNVYAGLNASHEWQAQKPYELAATLELIPDENNEAFFSINDILKAYVKTENNLLLSTLPNNIDAWTNFYIETAEQYDTSDGYTVTTNQSGFTSDLSTFEGMAINSKLPFKNVHSGSMSDYIAINSASKFLTLFDTPVLFTGAYQDISWLKHDNLPIIIKKEYSLNGDIGTTITETSTDSGVIRTEIEADCNYDTLSVTGVVENSISNPSVNRNTAGLTNLNHAISIPAGYSPIGTYSYTVQLAPTVSAADSAIARLIYFYADGTNEIVFTVAQTTLGSTSASNVVLPTSSKSIISITLQAEIIDAPPTTVNASVLLSVTFDADLASLTLTETKDFSIDCNCSQQGLPLSWIIYPAGFDYWNFTAQKGHAIDITEAGETIKNIFPNWPKSYGAFADTIRKQTNRTSIIKQFVSSQYLTQSQADAIAYIKSSPLVQIVNSKKDRRTVIVDTDSFLKYTDGDKTFTISFNIIYTDDIPSQSV